MNRGLFSILLLYLTSLGIFVLFSRNEIYKKLNNYTTPSVIRISLVKWVLVWHLQEAGGGHDDGQPGLQGDGPPEDGGQAQVDRGDEQLEGEHCPGPPGLGGG